MTTLSATTTPNTAYPAIKALQNRHARELVRMDPAVRGSICRVNREVNQKMEAMYLYGTR